MKPDLNQMFADAGWTPSEENFKPRAYVIDHGSFYSVAGFPPGLSCRSKSCKSEAEVLEFLKQESDVAPPLTSAELDARAILRIGGSYDDAMQTSGLSLEDVLKLQPLTPDQANTDSEEIAKLRARIAELEARPPEIRTVEKIVERVVEVPAAVVEAEAPEPYTPDFTLIPDALARFAAADETAADFRARLKSLWQRFGIEDGKNFPGGGEPLTGAEKITMREIDIVLNSDEGANAGLLTWLLAEERA